MLVTIAQNPATLLPHRWRRLLTMGDRAIGLDSSRTQAELLMATRPKVLIAVLCGPERHQWVNPSLVGTLIAASHDPRFAVEVAFMNGAHHAEEGRNTCVVAARAKQVDWLVQIDNDMTCPAVLSILTEANTAGLDIVSVAAGMIRSENVFKVNVSTPMERCGNFSRVNHAGAGILMIRSSVWSKLSGAPLFVWDNEVGEDGYFCRLANAADFKVWAHDRLAGHLKTTDITALLT
jgi:hypothetical protein